MSKWFRSNQAGALRGVTLETSTSLHHPQTKKSDLRISISGLKNHASWLA